MPAASQRPGAGGGEHPLVDSLRNTLDPQAHPRYVRAVVDGLTSTLPDDARTRLAGALRGWAPARQPAPDLILGDDQGRGVGVFVIKAPGARPAQVALSDYRKLRTGNDRQSVRVKRRWYYGTDPALDGWHARRRCDARCRPELGTDTWGYHHPVLPEGDVYASTLSYLPTGLQAAQPSDLVHVLVSPDARTREAFGAHLRSGCWLAVDLPDVLARWTEQLTAARRGADTELLERLVREGRRFLGRRPGTPAG